MIHAQNRFCSLDHCDFFSLTFIITIMSIIPFADKSEDDDQHTVPEEMKVKFQKKK